MPPGAEPLPKGIFRQTSDLKMVPLWGPTGVKKNIRSQNSLLAMPVGIKQKETVNRIIKKFASSDFTVMLFHYDGIVDEWKDLQWSDSALHISAINQTKWWFAKRFLHPDIIAPYKYVFLWDEDLEVENFHPRRYLKIVEREGLEISQPALDPAKSKVHHQITARLRKGDVHRRMYKFTGGGKCYDNSSGPPCTGWIEMMAPVFSRAAWRYQDAQDEAEAERKFTPFTGAGRRLDGKPAKEGSPSIGSSVKYTKSELINGTKRTSPSATEGSSSRAKGKLVFGSNANRAPPPAAQKVAPKETNAEPAKKEEPKFQAFTGKKYSLKG